MGSSCTQPTTPEVRDFGQIPKGDSARVGRQELELSEGLIKRLSREDFEPEQFNDEYRLRVLAMIEEKRKDEEITIAAEPEKRRRPTPTIDLLQALKHSMERMPERRPRSKPARARKKRRRASGG